MSVKATLRYILIPGPSCGHDSRQAASLPFSFRPQMLRPKYSFILPADTGPVNLRLPQGLYVSKIQFARYFSEIWP